MHPECLRTESLRDPTDGIAGELDEQLSKAAVLSPEEEALIQSIAPLAFAPERLHVPAWSEKFLRVRVPSTALAGHDLAMLPLEDSRLRDLGVLVAPTLQRPDKDGYVYVRVVNPGTSPVVIPILEPIARFVVDPKISDMDLEFTVEQILEGIHLPRDNTDGDRNLVRLMLKYRRRLFSSKLGWAHAMKMVIRAPLLDRNEVEPPAQAARRLSPPELEALKAAVDKQIELGLIEPCVSPYCAQPMLIPKPPKDGKPQYRVVLDY